MDDHSSAALVTKAVKLPTRASGLKCPCGGLRCRSDLHPLLSRTFPHEAPIRHCSGWGLPCRSCCQDRGGLLPHRFTITADMQGAMPALRQSLLCGAFPGVAPAGRYPAPFLHGVRTFLGASPAVIQPSAHFGHICKVARRQAKNNSGPAIAMKRYYRRYLFAISDHHPRHLVCQRAILGGLVPLCKGTKTKSKGIKRRLCICVGIANSG